MIIIFINLMIYLKKHNSYQTLEAENIVKN